MQIIDCVANEVKYSGLPMNDAIARYEKLGGKRMGYCIAEDDEVLFACDVKIVMRETEAPRVQATIAQSTIGQDGFLF